MSSAVRLLRSPQLASSAQYAYAATCPGRSRLIWLAGACPLDAGGRVVSPGDVRAQALQVMGNLRIALRDAGAALEDVVSTRVLVASSDRTHLVQAWDVVRATFGDHDAPSTLLGVTVLGYPEQLVGGRSGGRSAGPGVTDRHAATRTLRSSAHRGHPSDVTSDQPCLTSSRHKHRCRPCGSRRRRYSRCRHSRLPIGPGTLRWS